MSMTVGTLSPQTASIKPQIQVKNKPAQPISHINDQIKKIMPKQLKHLAKLPTVIDLGIKTRGFRSIQSPLGRRVSKQASNMGAFLNKQSQGLNDYMKSKHPLLKQMSRPFSGGHRHKTGLTEKRREILANLNGINIQIKTLLESVVKSEKVKVTNPDNVQTTLFLNSSNVKELVQKSFTDISQIFRHLLRTMVKLDQDNGVVAQMLSQIWQCVTYFLDTTMDLNKNEVEDAINKIKIDYDNKKKDLNEFIESCAKKYEKNSEKFKLNIERLKQENMRIDTIARDREHQLRIISNPEGIKEYKAMLSKFNSYVSKHSEQKEAQLSAMNSMLGMIKECKLEPPKPHHKVVAKYKRTMSKNKIEKLLRAQNSITRSLYEDREDEEEDIKSMKIPSTFSKQVNFK